MKSLALLLPRFVLDRTGRAAVSVAVLLALAVPLLPGEGSSFAAGFARGSSVGGSRGAAVVARVVAAVMALAAAWLADGVVSDLRRDGSGGLVLTRPVSRAGLFASRWLAGFVSLAAVGVVSVLVINGVWRAGSEGGPVLSVAGAIGAAAVTWLWVGSAVLLFSSLLERGEALAGAVLFALPILLAPVLRPGGRVAQGVAALPSRGVLIASTDLFAGVAPSGDHVWRALIWGAGILALGLLTASRREWSTAA